MKKLILVVLGFSFLVASVDLNTATQKELISLKGIGKSKAEAIIEYRKKNCFKSIDEVVKVKGIGKKFVEKHKSELSVGECE